MLRAPLIALLLLLSLPAMAATGHQHVPDCQDPGLACARTVTPWQAPDGTLWLAWSAAGQVSVARSADGGKTLSPAVIVSGAPAAIDDNGEARPKVFADGKGLVLATWTVRKDQAFSGQAFVARSTDGGASFAPPRPLTNDPVSQRFETLGFLQDGTIVAAWIDKRGLAAAKKTGTAYAGAAIALAWSSDGGLTFERETLAADHSCECCRLALSPAPDGTLLLTWRHIYDGGVRDHAVARIDGTRMSAPTRLAVDDWQVQACPHHGPALAVTADGAWHAAWYTKGKVRQGLFLARSSDAGAGWSEPLPVGSPAQRAGHAALLAAPDGLWLAWKEFDGERTSVKARFSADHGRSWGADRVVAVTPDASDHPLLVLAGGRASLSWATRAEGWRLIPLEVP